MLRLPHRRLPRALRRAHVRPFSALNGGRPGRALLSDSSYERGAPLARRSSSTSTHRRIYAYCLRQLGSPEEAEDAVQATYLNACRSLMDGFEPDVAQAWLFKVAHNVCLTRQRSRYRRARRRAPRGSPGCSKISSPLPRRRATSCSDSTRRSPDSPTSSARRFSSGVAGLSYREVAAELGSPRRQSRRSSSARAVLWRARSSSRSSTGVASALGRRGRPPRLAQGLDRRQCRGERGYGRRGGCVGNGLDGGDDPARQRLPFARHAGAPGREDEARHPAGQPRGPRFRRGGRPTRRIAVVKRPSEEVGRHASSREWQGQAQAREQRPQKRSRSEASAREQSQRVGRVARPGELDLPGKSASAPAYGKNGKKG